MRKYLHRASIIFLCLNDVCAHLLFCFYLLIRFQTARKMCLVLQREHVIRDRSERLREASAAHVERVLTYHEDNQEQDIQKILSALQVDENGNITQSNFLQAVASNQNMFHSFDPIVSADVLMNVKKGEPSHISDVSRKAAEMAKIIANQPSNRSKQMDENFLNSQEDVEMNQSRQRSQSRSVGSIDRSEEPDSGRKSNIRETKKS